MNKKIYIRPAAEIVLLHASELLQSGSPVSANGLDGVLWGGSVDDLPEEEIPDPSVKANHASSGWDEW